MRLTLPAMTLASTVVLDNQAAVQLATADAIAGAVDLPVGASASVALLRQVGRERLARPRF